MKFPCTACGACCRRVRGIHPDWPVQADGVSCVHLNPDLSCAIYDTRPDICRVDVSKPPEMSVGAWHALNARACNALQVEDQIPEALRVNLNDEDGSNLGQSEN